MTAARTAFAVNWALTSPRLRFAPLRRIGRLGEVRVGQPRFLTTVVRLPAEIAERLVEAGSRLARMQPGHYLYPAESIHLTVLALADAPGVEREVEAVLGRRRRFAIDVRGLNVSSSTVFAELHPRGPGLRALREELRSVESHEHPAASRWLRRRLAHANLMRFTGPLRPSALAELRSLRRASFGSFEVGEVEVALTDKVLSRQGTRTLGRIQLG